MFKVAVPFSNFAITRKKNGSVTNLMMDMDGCYWSNDGQNNMAGTCQLGSGEFPAEIDR